MSLFHLPPSVTPPHSISLSANVLDYYFLLTLFLVFALACISELYNILISNCFATHEMHNMIFGNYALKHISTFVMIRVGAHLIYVYVFVESC